MNIISCICDGAHKRLIAACCGIVFGICVITLPSPPLVRADPPSAEEQFDALCGRYQAEIKRFSADVEKVQTDEERIRLYRTRWPVNSMVDEFLAFEEQHRGTLVGLSVLHHVVSAGWYPDQQAPSAFGVQKALRILKDHYADHVELDLFFFLVGE